tara:strand:- start:3021 stop:3392 length:372 start_codon:yes stop_codon:yes gene_type:complete
MNIITVPDMFKPTIKNHHKARHMKKMAIGPFSQTCVEFRFNADIEKFEQVDDALIESQQNWDLFTAYFNDQYHVAINFFTEQEELNTMIEVATAIIIKEIGDVEFQILAGDANYGDWDSCYTD